MPAAAIPAIAAIAGGVMGQQEGQKGRDAAERATRDALSQFQGISLPDIEQQKLNLETPSYLGGFTPEQLQVLNLGPSQMGRITTNPEYQQAQLHALQGIAGVAEKGVTPEDAAALELIRRKTGADFQSKMNQILQEQNMRGVGGAGSELAAKMKAAQAASDMEAQMNAQQAIQQQQARQQALSQLGSMSSAMQQQQFGQEADKARAADIINQFNVANAQQVSRENVGSKNQAGLRNLSEQQRLAENAANIRNQQQQFNRGLTQQQFQNQLGLAGARAGAYGNMAQQQAQAGANTAAGIAGIGQGAGTLLAGMLSPSKKLTDDVQTQGMPNYPGLMKPD